MNVSDRRTIDQTVSRLNLRPLWGVIGDSQGNMGTMSMLQRNMYYVRYPTSNGFSMPVPIRGPYDSPVTLQPGQCVKLGYDSENVPYIKSVDFGPTLAAGGNPVIVPPPPSGPVVTQGQLATLKVFQDYNQPSLKVNINGWKAIVAGVLYDYGGTAQFDLSSFVPGSGHAIIGIFLKDDNLTPIAYASPAISLNDALGDADVNNVLSQAYTANQNYTPVWAYAVKTGATQILDTDTFLDMRQFLNASVAAAGGTITGPASSTDTAVVRWSGTTGKVIQNSGVLIDASNNVETPGGVSIGSATTPNKALDIFYGDLRFDQITAPGAPSVALVASAGNIDAGAHIWKVTFVNAAGETALGTASSTLTTDAGHGQVSITAIPLGSVGQGVTSRKIYRTKAGGSSYFLLTTISDNTTTTYTDNTADASLGANDATNIGNTTAGAIWIGTIKSGFLSTLNTAFGENALASNTTGNSNVAIGVQALQLTTTGNSNIAVGVNALQNNTTGGGNTAVGGSALQANISGANNMALGIQALQGNTTGTSNAAIGPQSLLSNTTGNNNVAIGVQAGYTTTPANANTTGSQNTFIGGNSGPGTSTQLSQSIAIGWSALVNVSSACVIGAATAGGSASDVNLGVGTTSPTARGHFVLNDTATNVVGDVAIFSHDSNGSIAANFGAGVRLQGQSSTTADRDLSRWRSYWSTATDASRATISILSSADSTGLRDVIGWGANGSAGLLGFYSIATAPIAQPTTAVAAATFVQGAGNAVNDASTFDSYTIKQVVKALRNLGVLA